MEYDTVPAFRPSIQLFVLLRVTCDFYATITSSSILNEAMTTPNSGPNMPSQAALISFTSRFENQLADHRVMSSEYASFFGRKVIEEIERAKWNVMRSHAARSWRKIKINRQMAACVVFTVKIDQSQVFDTDADTTWGDFVD